MRFYSTVSDAITGYADELGESIADAFRRLLETKHLYQSVKVEESAATKNFWTRVESRVRGHLQQTKTLSYEPSTRRWMLAQDYRPIPLADTRPDAPHSIAFDPTHAKLYCRTCGRIEAFNRVSGASAIHVAEYPLPVIGMKGTIEQVYTLCYLCQSCKKFPEVFMIRRTGGKLTLVGRTPMEHVDVPAVIPKDIAKFYSGAVIAHQSGQTLAGLFMLRTASEQFARKWAVPEDRSQAAIDKYMASLPDDFKGRFPSLADIYSQLSADIHAATGSAELFIDMTGKFVEHFDARRLYKLREPA